MLLFFDGYISAFYGVKNNVVKMATIATLYIKACHTFKAL